MSLRRLTTWPLCWPLCACLVLACAAGCSGGWTGEITGPSACREVVATRATSALSEDETALLTLAQSAASARVMWSTDALETELVLSAEPTSADAQIIGGEGCETPFAQVPVALRLTSADARLDELLPGSAELLVPGVVLLRARAPLEQLRGSLELGEGLGEGTLVVEIVRQADESHGSLLFEPADETRDHTALMVW